jgi:spermidine synthase
MTEPRSAGAHPVPVVREALDSRTLSFSSSEIQSRMQLLAPDALDLEYTRTMMGFLMFRPEPSRIAMLGLGGGSMAKFCHRHLPGSQLLVVEINPHVIALREAFQVPPDDSRFRVLAGDAAQFVAETDARFDVLLVDAFDAQGTPPALCTQRFYDDCLDVLEPGGLLVMNMHAGHPLFDVFAERLNRSCGGHLLRVPDRDGTNTVVFACKGQPLPALATAARRPRGMAPAAWTQLSPACSRIAHAQATCGPAGRAV